MAVIVAGLPEANYAELPNGQRLHYLDNGSGPVVVFLHGSGSGASGHSNFKYNYPYLVEQGYRVIVPDLIGYGYSDKPDNVQYHLDFFVECIKQLLDHIGVSSCALIGNSLGGAIAIKFTLDNPSQVDKLVLMAPGGIEEQADYFHMPGMQVMKEVFTSGPMAPERLEDFIRRGLVYDDSVVDEQLINERWGIFQQQNSQVITSMVVPNMTERLSEIRCPVLAFWGVNEKMMPETGIQKLAKGCPNIRLTLVSQCGHWVMVEHRNMFNRSTDDFLRNG
ncbi:alpha/beta hydrolase [Zhongshania sp.]|jgi:4,5:9,10-diseco-3-hydroxy-5,9,17-trioxoandrosta-1(10),2-diene-4-oate hydrolase|uniref:alpha/beta fold hydrolase n=1 Tax=Zhongshania sp. TaxID=1971902 RepID=UPI001B3EFA70|nr:alpha/beta hydrolase [Zhongshania sp.]MBQ0797616.1 alpha/beta fold hydrolase [Zhongshania sp.]|tara:strand:- start:1376 stop:2209 length:834 start_codon:yes stop_codon:yes gene_type:complete